VRVSDIRREFLKINGVKSVTISRPIVVAVNFVGFPNRAKRSEVYRVGRRVVRQHPQEILDFHICEEAE
jgi:hypothetical protein